MSGRWQHNIPQSFQRGFRVPGGTKKTSQVWLFEKGQEPRLEFVKKIAAADDFYSAPSADGSATLDDQITEYERTSFDRAFQCLKNAEPNSLVDPSVAAEVVDHLTIRNDHLRLTFGEAAQKLFSDAAPLFSDEKRVRPLLGIDDKKPPARFTEKVDEFLSEHPEFKNIPLPIELVHRVAHMAARESFNSSFLEFAPQVVMILAKMVEQAPSFMREGHNRALAQGLLPGQRAKVLQELTWTVRAADADGFILPDCVALGLEPGKSLQPFLMAGPADSALIFMPLSSQRMLVGTKGNVVNFNLADFNKAAASCSHRFFIGGRKEFEDLMPCIGNASERFMDETVNALVQQYEKEQREDGDTVKNIRTIVAANDDAGERRVSQPSPPKYSIKFEGCADQATSERIAANVFALTDELSRTMPLERLDGVTFAHDYQAALLNLDRGFAAEPLQPTNEEYGVGVAMAPTVIREGIYKTHIVLRGEMGHYLIGDDEASRRLALQIILQQLERVSAAQIFEEAFPSTNIDDHFEGFLFRHANSAWRDYFSARTGAGIYPEVADGYCDIAAAVIRRAHDELVAARLEYFVSGDMNKLMQIAISRVREILQFSATVLGHFDGQGKTLLEIHPALAETLKRAGLHNWIMLFDAELAALWLSQDRWSSFDEFLALNRHVERIFWQHGLFPWKDGDQIRVEVRLVTDADRMLLSA